MSRKITFLFMLVLIQDVVFGQPQEMRDAPKGAYANYFNYYDSLNPAMPLGAALTSDAIMGIGALLVRQDPFRLIPGFGTGFLITSDRTDGKVCLCTAGHLINDLPTTPAGNISLTVYMKYTGRANASDPRFNETISGWKSIVHARVIGHFYSPGNNREDADASLMLVDPAEFPRQQFATLGVDFTELYNSGSGLPSTSYTTYYTMGHPHNMAQRVQNLFRRNGFYRSPVTFLLRPVDGIGNALAIGYSGSPVIYTGGAEQTPPGPFVTGISVGVDSSFHPIPAAELVGTDLTGNIIISYALLSNQFATKIAVLKELILKECWNRKSRQELDVNKNYRASVIIDNSIGRAEFNPTRTVASAADLTAAASPNYGKANPGNVLVKGLTVTFSCPVVPDANSKNIYVLAPTTHLTNGFSYTAIGDNVFEVNTAALEPMGVIPAAARNHFTAADLLSNAAPKQKAATSSLFKVRPNPSATGIFKITVPVSETNKKYTITVTATDGKVVAQKNIPAGRDIQVDISNKARGIYVLKVYENTNVVYTTQLVY